MVFPGFFRIFSCCGMIYIILDEIALPMELMGLVSSPPKLLLSVIPTD